MDGFDLDLVKRALGTSSMAWVSVFAILTGIEFLFGREKQSLTTRLTGLAFWAMWIPVATLIALGFRMGWDALGIAPLLTIDFSAAGIASLILAPLLAALVGDFFFYWCHRAEHTILWRFHRVHHSIRDLSAINSYHHISEAAIQTALITLPLSLLVADPPAMGIVVLLLRLQPVFLHSPVKFGLGPLRSVLADNHFHRIHHSLDPAHFDRNFGAFTTLWDRLFGTAYMPRADEWPDVGLADVAPPQTVRQWLLPWQTEAAAQPTAQPTLASTIPDVARQSP